ncbi:metallophosphoesterase MPPED2 [Labeo rohita]|uniref:Metallophosphoesterase MPPED2 n=4 Tax=Cyprinidae TaxID=7953 RepID=A0A498MZK5_LABRO|nr:metallophosphoesterase MPPED2 [Labeo rohita]
MFLINNCTSQLDQCSCYSPHSSDSTAVLSDPSGSARSLHSSLSGSPSSHIEAVLSLLSPSFLVCRISVRVLVERDPGGRRFCPARRDLNPSRLPKYPMTVVFDTSADNPRAVLGQKRRGAMARRISSQGKVTISVDEYSSNPTQAFTHYNINQSRFQPPHVHMVEPLPYDAPKPVGHTRFVCVSDTHSRTDGIQMPFGDVLLHTGDFTELGLPSEVKKFNDWLGSLPYEYKVVIAGNHELTFDKDFMSELIKQDYYRFPSVSKLRTEDFDDVQSLLTNCVYLQDSEVTIKGFRIYGTPWTPWFNGWGFNLPRGQSLLDKWNQIPEDVDILMTHGPPLGFRDWVPKELQRVGCVELLNTVQKRVRPKLHAYGGIHEGYGIMTDGYTTFINSSTCTVSFQPTNPPIIFDLPNPGNS